MEWSPDEPGRVTWYLRAVRGRNVGYRPEIHERYDDHGQYYECNDIYHGSEDSTGDRVIGRFRDKDAAKAWMEAHYLAHPHGCIVGSFRVPTLDDVRSTVSTYVKPTTLSESEKKLLLLV